MRTIVLTGVTGMIGRELLKYFTASVMLLSELVDRSRLWIS